jgi:ribose/xylose/arabinose/galactoside ABC-type transport system permease subunit
MSQPAAAATWRAPGRWRSVWASEHLVLGLSVAYFLILLPWVDGLAGGQNLVNLLFKMLPLLVGSLGQTCVLVAGGIDLSVSSIIGLSSVLGAMTVNVSHGWLGGQPWATAAGVFIMVATGMGVGLLNGTAVTLFSMPPFIVTLTSMMLVSGYAVWLTQSRSIGGLPPSFNALGGQLWLALPLTSALVLAIHVGLSRSLHGRWLYAVGQNSRTAHVSGVPVASVVLLSYLVSGLCAGVASVLYTGRLETGSPVLGQQILLDAIGAAVIGGTSLFGGRGKVLWTFYGVLFFVLIDNSLELKGCSHFTIMMVKGGVILLAALLDTQRHRLAQR